MSEHERPSRSLAVVPAVEGREAVSPLAEVGVVFLRLGCIAFGGPAAHTAMMREEIVRRRGWLNDARFLDLVSAVNLIPGPNSTELAIHLGYLRAGRRGLVLAGVAFILPAFLIVLALAWAYVRFGAQPAAGWLLYGIKPVIIAVVVQALWSLGRVAVKGPLTAVVGLGVVALVLAGGNEIVVLFAAGLVVMLAVNARRLRAPMGAAGLLPLLGWTGGPLGWAVLMAGSGSVSLLHLFLFFLRTGSVLFGSGYVLLAFLRADLVERWG